MTDTTPPRPRRAGAVECDLVGVFGEVEAHMTLKPWYRKTTMTVLLRAVAIFMLILYLSLLVGARFA